MGRGFPGGPASLSWIEGLAVKHPDSNWEELELVAGANAALENAKKTGRNRVAAAEGKGEPTEVPR